MPTILTHPAVPLALAIGLGGSRVSKRLLLAGVAGSMLPDIDVVAFHFGVEYADALGHRGITHSIFLALLVAALGASQHRTLRASFSLSFNYLFLSIGSHGLLDALTNGGLGIALLWPFSAERFFAPWQFIEVSPIGLSAFLSARGAVVLWSELCWVWAPLAVIAATATVLRWVITTRRLT